MAGRRFIYALGLIESLIFYGAYQKWFSWILLLTVVFLPWISLLLSLGDMIRTKLEVAVAARISAGTKAAVQLNAQFKDLPLPVKSKICVTKPLTGEKWVLKPGGSLPADHCGGLTVQLLKPRVFDHLGLFGLPVRGTGERKILIWPEPLQMEIPADLTQYLARSWRPKPGGGYAENHEIRQYHPGDSLNQIHWKLSAKVGGLMLREPMEPECGLMLLTMDLCGTSAELDRKLGRLLWLGNWLLEQSVTFEIRVLSGNGIESWAVSDAWSLQKSIEALLFTPCTPEGSIRDRQFTAVWQHHIGGEPDEA